MAYRGWAIMILMFLVFVMGLAVLNTIKLANTPVTAFEAPTPLPTVQLPGMVAPALKMVTDQTFGRGMMLGDTFIQCAKVVGPGQWISQYQPGIVYAGQIEYGKIQWDLLDGYTKEALYAECGK